MERLAECEAHLSDLLITAMAIDTSKLMRSCEVKHLSFHLFFQTILYFRQASVLIVGKFDI